MAASWSLGQLFCPLAPSLRAHSPILPLPLLNASGLTHVEQKEPLSFSKSHLPPNFNSKAFSSSLLSNKFIETLLGHRRQINSDLGPHNQGLLEREGLKEETRQTARQVLLSGSGELG